MIKKLNLFFETAIFLLLFALLVFLTLNGGYGYAVSEAINLWAACVIPSLFPYFFIAAILSSLKISGKFGKLLSPLTKTLFNCSGNVGYAYLISLVSGYPVGAKMVSDLKNNRLLNDSESVRAACVCSTSSPMFLIGSVGNLMFKRFDFGLKLFAIHFLSSLITGVLFSFYKRKTKPQSDINYTPQKVDNLLYNGVYSAVISILMVGGLITVFYVLTEVLYSLGIFSPVIKLLTLIFGDENFSKGIVFGLFECTKGLKSISVNFSIFSLPISAAICGFGGLSVIAQSVAYLKNAKIKTAPFVLSKLTAAVINFIIALLINLFLPI